MTKRLPMLTSAMGALAACGIATTAFAGTTDAPPQAAPVAAAPAAPATAAPADSAPIADIVVTAERREQSLQKVPVAVTAFTAQQRDVVGIKTLSDFTNFVPGLTYNASQDHLFVRGVGRQSLDLAADAGVAAYIDGFYNPDPVQLVLPPLFTGGIEVLRGPQGTLQGRNGIAGAMLFQSVKPSDTPYAEGVLGIGNQNTRDAEFAVSGPLMDGLKGRLAAYDYSQDGYEKNLAGGPREGGNTSRVFVEGSLAAEIGNNFDAFVKLSNSHTRTIGAPGVNTNPYSTFLNDDSDSLSFNPAFAYSGSPLILPGSVVQKNNAITGNPSVNDPNVFSSAIPTQGQGTRTWDLHGYMNYRLPWATLKYTGGYAQSYYSNTSNSEAFDQRTDVLSYTIVNTANPTCATTTSAKTTCLTIFPLVQSNFLQTDKWWSHELTLTSTNKGPVQWVGGLFYYDERFTNPITATMPNQPQVATPFFTGAPTAANAAPANPGNALYTSSYNFHSTSKAVFGQVDWSLNKSWKLTGGLRYTDDNKGGPEFYRVVVFGGTTEAQKLGTTALAPFTNPATQGAALPAFDLTKGICAGLSAPVQGAGPCVYNATTGVASRNMSGESSAVTGTAGIEWTPDSTTLGYARYNRGYKEIGFNAGKMSATAEVPAEYMNDYEIGLKKSFFDRTLVVDLALFYEDYINGQFLIGTSNGATVITSFVSVPKSRSDGIELETTWKPNRNFQLVFTYALDDTAVLTSCNKATQVGCFADTANPNPGGQSVRGNPLPNAPKNKITLNPSYTFHMNSGDLILSGTYLWRDEQYGSLFKTSWYRAPSWNQVDLRATWRAPGGKYEVIAYGANIFNQTGYAAGPLAYQYGDATNPAVYSSRSTFQNDLNPPRTFGVELHYKFF